MDIEDYKSNNGDLNIDALIDAFEACAQHDENGHEYWSARDLQRLYEYGEWRFFKNPIDRAIVACEESGNNVTDHFVQVHDMVQIGSNAERQVENWYLSRYACYLIAMNCNPRKSSVAFAQTYFAIQTRRQELADRSDGTAIPMSEDEKRVYLRNQIKEHNKHLSSAAKNAGVITPQEFAIFHSHGYQGLYGRTVPEIRRYKGLKKSVEILDRMGSTELAANFFRVTQTEEKLRKENIKGKEKANRTHYEVGRQVRDAMLKISGIAPEDLPALDNIKQAEKRIKTHTKPLDDNPDFETPIPKIESVDLKNDLWKYALLIMVQKPNMEITTSDLIKELPNYITIPEKNMKNNDSRPDSKFSQLVRNLKSHKTSKSNLIYQGYAEDIPSGFKATEKGKAFILEYFANRIKHFNCNTCNRVTP